MPVKGEEAKRQVQNVRAEIEAEQAKTEQEIKAAKNRIPRAEPVKRFGVPPVDPVRVPTEKSKSELEKSPARTRSGEETEQSARGRESSRRRLTKLSRELGPIVKLLEDPLVADVWRNNDGSIWVNKVGVGVTPVNYKMSDNTAQSMIGTIAESMGQTINASKPIFEGILPTPDKSRFSASIPPVCNGGFMFCIRKRAVMSRTLDDYLEAGSATRAQVSLLLKRIRARDNFLIVGATGSGKALPLTAKILTPTGYVLMKDIKFGDRVMGQSGRSVAVSGVFPQKGLRATWTLRFSDGTETVADAEHLWAVRTKVARSAGRDWMIKTTDQLRQDLNYANGAAKWFIPMVEPLHLKKQATTGDPYLVGRLLGSKILDGSSIGVDDLVKSRGATRSALPFSGLLRDLGLFEIERSEQFIPAAYLWNDLENRISLFQGLMDGGAWFQKNTNHVAFTTRSEKLAQEVAWLVQSFGGTARIQAREDRGHRGYRVYVRLPEGIVPSRNPDLIERYRVCTYRAPSRSIVSIEKNKQIAVQCISVAAKDELYVIEHAVVTHNTTLGNAILREMSEGVSPDDRFVILEDTAELQCEAQNRVEALTAPGVTMNDLLKACMRWSPKRICIGELRGREAADLIKAWNTGHTGGITTIHSESARRALDRLEDLIAESGASPNKRRIADAVQCIVVIADIGKGFRKITEIVRVTGAVEADYNLESFDEKIE